MPQPKGPNPYLHHPKDRRRTTELWEKFQLKTLDVEEVRDPYVNLLVGEWRRCEGLGVDPNMQGAEALSPDELQRLLESKHFLLDKAKGALDRVQSVLTGVPGILIFTDEEGTILRVTGDPAVREKAAALSNLAEGACWAESSAGSNGIGTAIARRAPVHVYSSEHYCEAWHKWTCAGSPVLDPFGNTVLGVVDFTTFESDFRLEALALAQSLASNIAAELRVQVELERLQLIHQHTVYAARYPGDSVLVYDRMGHLVRCDAALNPGTLGVFAGDVAVLPAPPKEVRQVFVPSSNTPIGVLVVLPKTDGSRFSSPASVASCDVVAFGDFVTADPEVKRVVGRVEKIIPTDLNVLLIGETGTGKELLASYIHSQSHRREGPFVAVNCGAISKELFESKFFGYERGGFTGADPRGRKGLFEAADGGTLFLDEIGELPLDIQAALLRVLETGTFRRIGSEQERSTNCRVVAATNRSLVDGIQNGTFRSDLYYRLSVAKAEIPPLRQRRLDLPVLVEHLIRKFCKRHGIPTKGVGPGAMQVLTAYEWPGNGRELRNVVEAAVVCSDEVIGPQDLPSEVLAAATEKATRPAESSAEIPGARNGELSVREHERRLILTALHKYKKMSLAARVLGMSRSTLYRRVEALGIDPKQPGREPGAGIS